MSAQKRSNPRLVLVLVDDQRRTAFVRGSRVGDVLRYIDDHRARWNESGNGWVIPSERVPDLVAYCDMRNLLTVVRTKGRDSGAAS